MFIGNQVQCFVSSKIREINAIYRNISVKNVKGGSFGIFQHPFCRKTSKKLKGAFSLARYCMLRVKEGKTFLVQFPRPNGSIGHHKIL